MRLGKQSRARNLRLGHAQIKHGGSEMFGGVDFPVHAQNLLRARDADVVHRLEAKVAETGAQAGRGGQHQANAGGAAVKVESKLRTKPRHAARIGREDLIDIRISGEHRREAILHHYGDLQIRPGLLQQ